MENSWMPGRVARVLTRKANILARMLRQHGTLRTIRFVVSNVLEDQWILGRLVELLGNRGRLRGLEFDLDSPHINTRLKSRFLINTWEMETLHLVDKYLPTDLPVVEFGACIGVVSCFMNKRLENPKAHVVVEANENLIPLLERNRNRNGRGFKIMNSAIDYTGDTVTFHHSDNFNEGKTEPHNYQHETSVVSTISLQAILEQEGFEKICLISDIERKEHDLIEHEGQVLVDHVEWFLVEMHDMPVVDPLREPCPDDKGVPRSHAVLEDLGFRRVADYSNNWLYHNDRF